MNKFMGWVVVCLLGLTGCTIERFDDADCGDDGFDKPTVGGRPAVVTPDQGGTKTYGGSGGSASEPSGGGSSNAPVVPPKSCSKERDCEAGYNCDAETQQCVPADEETCAELETEPACTHRSDCIPIYGGTNCSCGQDCECKGGEPGCVCESFQFFACQATE